MATVERWPIVEIQLYLFTFNNIIQSSHKQLLCYLFLFTGDMLYIPQYWWHVVRSYDSPNIAVNMWFGLFNYEDKFQEAGISEDTDVVKVVVLSSTTFS